MPPFSERVSLGRLGLLVGRLGVSGGYGVDAKSVMDAFDRGVNYFYHGSLRAKGMRLAIRELVAMGRRDQLAIVLQSYTRWPWHLERSLARGLKQLGLDHADVLLLGWYNRTPAPALLERAARLKEKGMFRHLAISGHKRPSFVVYAADERFSVLHLRYSAAHTGAETDVFPHLVRDHQPRIVAYTATRWGSLLKPPKHAGGSGATSWPRCLPFRAVEPERRRLHERASKRG